MRSILPRLRDSNLLSCHSFTIGKLTIFISVAREISRRYGYQHLPLFQGRYPLCLTDPEIVSELAKPRLYHYTIFYTAVVSVALMRRSFVQALI